MVASRREPLPREEKRALKQSRARNKPIETSTTILVRTGNVSSNEAVVWGASANPYLRIAVAGCTDQGGRSALARKISSWTPSTRTGVADWHGKET